MQKNAANKLPNNQKPKRKRINEEQNKKITPAKFVKSGLVSGTRYYFRVAVIDKNGQNPWSNVLNIIAM